MEVSKLHRLLVDCNYLVSTDTRKIIPKSIFFALKGENFDGNDYAIEAIKNICRIYSYIGCKYIKIEQKNNIHSQKYSIIKP